MHNNVLIIFAIIAIINSFLVPVKQEKVIDYELECTNSSGKWVKDHNECEFIGKNWCDGRRGIFEECASACRHDPKS
ncbi:MAG: hypothetical protein PHU74_01535, partial [Candidatus Pacebacteria bacterium]|nr:hypothetical protein [Candidatus Paceibacterota bacterium]